MCVHAAGLVAERKESQPGSLRKKASRIHSRVLPLFLLESCDGWHCLGSSRRGQSLLRGVGLIVPLLAAALAMARAGTGHLAQGTKPVCVCEGVSGAVSGLAFLSPSTVIPALMGASSRGERRAQGGGVSRGQAARP